MTLRERIDEAVAFICEHEPPEGWWPVMFSGGKDSIVTHDLVKKSGVKYQAYYSMTLLDPPEVVAFIREHYPEVKFLKPNFSFWRGCMAKGMPLGKKRWCCDELKHNTKSSRAIPVNSRIVGIRAEESPRRKARGPIQKMKSGCTKQTLYCPIFSWTEKEIWEYIYSKNLAYPSLYSKGFTRIGCIVCPFIRSKKKFDLHKKEFPEMYKILDIYLNKLWHRDKKVLLDQYFTYEEFMRWPLWKTKEQRKQMNLDYDHEAKI